MNYETILSLLTLIALQNVLGTDNDIFISVSSDKLTGRKKNLVRLTGVILAVVFRIALLFAISFLLKSERTLFTLNDTLFSLKNIILAGGGIFLIYASTKEIYRSMEPSGTRAKENGPVSFVRVLLQIILADFLFSSEAIITAVGVAEEGWVLYTGVGIGIVLMLLLSVNINKFLSAHPSLKALSFCFLFLIGFSLICEAFEMDVPKSYIYFIMVFAVIIDLVQMKLKGKKITAAH